MHIYAYVYLCKAQKTRVCDPIGIFNLHDQGVSVLTLVLNVHDLG